MFQALRRRLQKMSLAGSCDIIVPLFNRPDALRSLLQSLEAHTSRKLLGRIWIGDDGSDRVTTQALADMVSKTTLPVTVVCRETNVGFALNCNDLFSRCTGTHVIVMNSDVRLPPFWLQRMLQAFADPSVALATPYATNGANHTVRLNPGQSWVDADRLFASRVPVFPDDCTAIGFCMGVDRQKLTDADIVLFDPAFGRGYGEDTDLHYRVLQAGFRSVIVDHLLVFHEGAASFSALPDAPKIRERGTDLFWKRWADRHTADYATFEQSGALAQVMDPHTHVCRFRAPRRRLDVLFVLPSSYLRYGGVWFVCKLTEHLIAQGYAAAVYVQDPENLYSDFASFGFRAYENLDDLRASVSEIGCVIATSDATIPTADSFAAAYGSFVALFLQNMEVCFRSGISIQTFRAYEKVARVIAVSQGLADYFHLFNSAADARALPIGPDPLVFYPRDVARVPKTVAIAVNEIPEKGYTHALEVALLLKQRGFSLTFFGWDAKRAAIPDDIGTVLHATDRQALADLFSRTEFMIDHSYLEGLGLLPLEAAFCGCVPILASKGAPEYIFEDGTDSIRLTGYKTLGATLDRIASFSPTAVSALRKNAMRLRQRWTLDKGCTAFENVLDSWSVKKEAYASELSSYALKPR